MFELDGQRYGFPADRVQEVVRIVAIAPLPQAPSVIEGVVNVRGDVVVVFDMRARFGLQPRELDPAQHLIILRAGSRLVAVRVDAAEDVLTVPDTNIAPPSVLATSVAGPRGARHVTGVAATPDGIIVIHDLDEFLSAAESEVLDGALAPARG